MGKKFDYAAKGSSDVRPCEKNNRTVVHFIYDWLWRYVQRQVMFLSDSHSSFLLGWAVIYWALVSKSRCPALRKTVSFIFALFSSLKKTPFFVRSNKIRYVSAHVHKYYIMQTVVWVLHFKVHFV